MKFAKKISIFGLISLILSTNCTFIANAYTIETKSATNINVNQRSSISMDRAKQIILNKVSNGILVSFSYDYNDDGIPVYKGKVLKGNYEYEVKVNGNNGTILKFECDNRDYDHIYINISKNPISVTQAEQIMLNKVPGGILTEFSFDYDNRISSYEGKIRKENMEYEIKVDANSGTILKFEYDYKDGNIGNTNSSISKNLIGETKAKQIMLEKVPGGKVIFITFEYDDGMPEYEAKIVKGNMEYEISVNGYTGSILDFESEHRYDYSNSSSTNPNITANLISEAKAKEIMLNKVPNATITKFCLDLDDRIPEYKGKLVKGYREYEVSVHAITGAIIDYSSEIFDDALGHWAENTIFDFYNKGYINGYADNSFKPDGNITRAEFVKVLNKYFNLTKTSGVSFNDTKNHWAKSEIDIAVTNGICKGVSATEFNPDAPITREQAAVMIANYLNIKDTNYDKISKFKDKNQISSWAKSSIEALLDKGYLSGTSPTTLDAKNNTTRAQSITLLSRVHK